MSKYKAIVVVCLFLCHHISGQTDLEVNHQPPSLQIGLGGLSFGKGTLDAELVVSIISRKQEEIKSRLIKNMLLRRLDNAGGTLYIYVDNIIDVVLEEKNTETRTRNIFENTVNLVFVYALADYYFSLESDNLKELAATYYNVEKFRSLQGISPGSTMWDESNFNNFQIRAPNEATGKKYPVFKDEAGSQFKGLLLDISSEVTRNNEILQDLGLLRTVYRNTSIEKLNTYLQLIRTYPHQNGFVASAPSLSSLKRQIEADAGKIKKVKAHIDEFEENQQLIQNRAELGRLVYKEMSDHLNSITQYIGLINYLLNTTQLRDSSKLASIEWGDIADLALNSTSLSTFTEGLKNDLVELLGSSGREQLNDTELQVLLSLIKKLNLVKLEKLNKSSLSELIYELYNEVLPAVEKLTKNSSDFVNIYVDLHKLLKVIVANVIKDNPGVSKITNHFLYKLASKLYDFDKAKTYADYLNGLASLGNLFPNDDIKNSVNTIVSFLKNYAEVTEGTGDNDGRKVINFDVESFLASMQDIRYDKFRPLQFQFDVGANNAHFINEGLLIGDTETLSNYTYVGEKIGIKLKLYDWEYLRGFNKGETFRYYGKDYTRLQPSKNPVVSNIHLLLFGSGILYNLANTGTTKNFNRPIYGGGMGITFFNNLDLNLSIGRTIKSRQNDNNSTFINLGFDIRFSEYLQELQKKRQETRLAKKVDEIKSETSKKD